MPLAQTPDIGVRRSGGSGDLRHGNLTQILRYVRDHGASSRHDIARGCGLGISTMTDLIGELRSRRLVRELDPIRRPGAGRPTRPIDFDGEPWCVLGLHVDADRITCIAHTAGRREEWSEQASVDLRGAGTDGYAQIAEVLRDQVRRLPADQQIIAVEVGVGGSVAADRSTVLHNDRLGWRDFDLGAAVGATLREAGVGNVAVGVSNECQLAGLYAVRTELGLPTETTAVYLGGTRALGGGLISRGEIFRGAGGGAGQFGHLNVDPAGPPCWCGRSGCLESLAGPTALLTGAGLASAEEAAELLDRDPGAALQRLVTAAEAGEQRTLQALERAGDALGRTVDDLAGAVNPHLVVLGGYLAVLGDHLLPRLTAQLTTRLAAPASAGLEVVALDGLAPRTVQGAVLAARDACFTDPLALTRRL